MAPLGGDTRRLREGLKSKAQGKESGPGRAELGAKVQKRLGYWDGSR